MEHQHTDRLVEIVRNLRIVVDRMKKKPAVVEEEEGLRERVERMDQRVSAQEDSIQHLSYNVASLVNLLSNFFQVAHHQQEEVQTRTSASVANHQLTLSSRSSSLPDQVVHTTLQSQEKQSVESNKDVTLEEMINATAADAQQLCKVSEALAVLASASSSVSREREDSLNPVNKEINLDHSMMDKEGTDGEQDIMKAYEAAHEEIDDSTDGACSALTNRYYDGKVTSEELASATASTTGVHLEKTPMGPTLSSSSVPSGKGSSMVLTLENKSKDQPTVSSSILSSVSNSDMSLVGDYYNKYNYGDLSPEEEWRSGEFKKIAEDLDDFLCKVRTDGSVANDGCLGFAKLLNDELTLDNISRAVVGVTSLPYEDSVSERQEELIKEKEEQAKKKQSVESNKDVALEETINATAADAQQQARAIALDKQQLCKASEALPVLASAYSVSREHEESLNPINKEINLYHSMVDKEGTDGEQAAHEEIDDSTDEHVPDGASSAVINRDYDGKVTSEELDSATSNLKDAMAKDKG